MAVSMNDVRALLDPDEPRYQDIAALGKAALPHLRKLVGSADPMIASKAAYAASLIDEGAGTEVVKAAAHHDEPAVRVAAAAAAANLPTDAASEVLGDLVEDFDPGVRKVARSAIPTDAGDDLVERSHAASREMEGEEPDSVRESDVSAIGGLMPGETRPDADGTGLMPGETEQAQSSADAGAGAGAGAGADRMPGETG